MGQTGKLSRSEIAKLLGLGPATVTAQVRKLISDGYVRELAVDARSGAGRPRIPVELIPDSALVIGVSVTPTSLITVAMLIDGTIMNAQSRIFDPSQHVVEQFSSVVNDQRATLDHPERVIAVGISISGAVDQALTTVRISTTLNWQDFELGPQLQRAVDLPVFVSNDLFALSTREVSFGFGHDRDDFLLLGLGYGVGLGIVNRRRVFSGSGGSSTEFGHMSADTKGPRCVCGNYGCLQVYAGLEELLHQAPGRPAAGSLAQLQARLQSEQDHQLVDFMEDVGHRIGRSVGGVVNLLGIGTIIVTGETTILWPAMSDGFTRGLNETALKFLQPVEVTVKKWTESEDAAGAAGLALHNAISLNIPLETRATGPGPATPSHG